MLCLDEGTPVIMALVLLGSVFFIVGGSFWGNGDYIGDRQQTVAGVAMFAVSLLLLTLAGLGCWCNRFFCTPDRKSRIALRLYGGARSPLPAAAAAGDEDQASELQSQPQPQHDKDWEEYAGGSSYRSFRSGRDSTRRRQSRPSLRRDQVAPVSAAVVRQPQAQSQPPPAYNGAANLSSGNVNTSNLTPVPVELFSSAGLEGPGNEVVQFHHQQQQRDVREYHGAPSAGSQMSHSRIQHQQPNYYQEYQRRQHPAHDPQQHPLPHHLHKQQQQQQQQQTHPPLMVTPHLAMGVRASHPPPSSTTASPIVSNPVNV